MLSGAAGLLAWRSPTSSYGPPRITDARPTCCCERGARPGEAERESIRATTGQKPVAILIADLSTTSGWRISLMPTGTLAGDVALL
jgi:hypothetical protein